MHNGKLVPLTHATHGSEGTEILRYLINRHGPGSLQSHLLINADSLTRSADTLEYRYARDYENFELMRRYLNLPHGYETASEAQYYSAETIANDSLSVAGYRYMIKVKYPVYYTDAAYSWAVNDTLFTFQRNGHQAKFNFQPIIDRVLMATSEEVRHIRLPGSELNCQDEEGRYKLVIEHFSFGMLEGKTNVESFNGILLIP